MAIYLDMMNKLVFIFGLTLFSAPSWALDFTSTSLHLNCPSRGRVEVTLHQHDHVSMLWKEHYEVGAGHRVRDGVEFISFTNGDLLIHRSYSGEFLFRYAGRTTLQRCQKVSEDAVYARVLPYHQQ